MGRGTLRIREIVRKARLAGVDPTFTSLNGTDPVSYILSANVARRNLTKGQRAMAIARMSVLSQNTLRDLAHFTHSGVIQFG